MRWTGGRVHGLLGGIPWISLTLVQFDTEFEILHRGVPIDDVPEYRLEPRGMTAKKISRMRSQHRKGEEVLDEFTDEERKKMM